MQVTCSSATRNKAPPLTLHHCARRERRWVRHAVHCGTAQAVCAGCVRGVRGVAVARASHARQTTRNGAWGVAWAYVGQSAWRGCQCVRLDQLHAVVSLRSACAHCTEHNRHSQVSSSLDDSPPKGPKGPKGRCVHVRGSENPQNPQNTEHRTQNTEHRKQKTEGERAKGRCAPLSPSAPQNTEHRTQNRENQWSMYKQHDIQLYLFIIATRRLTRQPGQGWWQVGRGRQLLCMPHALGQHLKAW